MMCWDDMRNANIFLDFDGTLVDSNELKYHAYHRFLAVLDADLALDPQILEYFSMKAGSQVNRFQAVNDLLDFVKEKKFFFSRNGAELSAEFSFYLNSVVKQANIVPGSQKFLEKCNRLGVRIHVVSATPDSEIKEVVNHHFPSVNFTSISGGPATKAARLKLINSLEQPSRSLMIGDSDDDLLAASDVQIPFIGICFDGHERFSVRPEHTVTDFKELM